MDSSSNGGFSDPLNIDRTYLENSIPAWTEHPQMTRPEILHPGATSRASFRKGLSGGSAAQNDLRLTPELHFPLHFSRVDKSSASPMPGESPKGSQNSTTTPPPLDQQLVGGGGRDFLTPLFQLQSTADVDAENSRQEESGMYAQGNQLTSNAFHFADHFGLGAPMNLTVGDELPEPFASAMPVAPGFPSEPVAVYSTPAPTNSLSSSAHSSSKANSASTEDTDQVSVSAGPTTQKFRLTYPDLDEQAVELFDYFRDKQSTMMSVSPLNYFRSVFLAFSLRYRAIMYGILAWAAWHQGGQEDEARKFFDEGSALIRQESLNSRSKEEILAALLVLASAKICSGDTRDWRPYLILAGETIHLHGGLTSFMESESVRWLLKNFAYHEVLASSSLNLPKLFSANDFEIIFNQPSSASLPDTLCACCQPVFIVLERINELTRDVRLLLRDQSSASEASAGAVSSTLKSTADKETAEDAIYQIYSTAHELERKIWTLRPAHKILQHLSDRDLRLQLTLFDAFKLVAVLHMYRSVLRINAASLSVRVVARRLHSCIDELFGTMVEGILIFPLFMLGISTTTPSTRKYIVDRFTGMKERLNARNVTQAQALVEKVWAQDSFGRNFVDWNELVDSEGLHFCFA